MKDLEKILYDNPTLTGAEIIKKYKDDKNAYIKNELEKIRNIIEKENGFYIIHLNKRDDSLTFYKIWGIIYDDGDYSRSELQYDAYILDYSRTWFSFEIIKITSMAYIDLFGSDKKFTISNEEKWNEFVSYVENIHETHPLKDLLM